MNDDPISRIEAALENPALYDEGASIADTKMAVTVLTLACSPTAIRALLDRLKTAEGEIERLRGMYEDKAAELCNFQIAFNDWKVFHSTVRLEAENERLRAALAGVIAVADRKTDEFDRARAALENTDER